MKDKKTLKEKIIQSVFIYETKRITTETAIKIVVLFISIGTILIFGGVIGDIFVESEMGGLFRDFIKAREYSSSAIIELSTVVLGEVPQWLFILYAVGLLLGCILIASIIKNWKSISHKTSSIVCYWFKL